MMEAVSTVVQGLRHSRLTPTTRATYSVGQKAWIDFCLLSGHTPLLTEPMQVEQVAEVLEQFVGYLLAVRHISSTSAVNTYLSAVSALHVDLGIRSPTRSVRQAGLMQECLQGLHRVAETAYRAPPMTVLDLRPRVVQAFASGDERLVACAALCVLAATAMLRIHEYVVSEGTLLERRGLWEAALRDDTEGRAAARQDNRLWRARQALRTEDVTFVRDSEGKDVMRVRLRSWKYSPTGAEHINPIRCVGDWPVCAHCCVRRFLSSREKRQAERRQTRTQPWLAQLADGHFVTEADVTAFIRQAAGLAGRADWMLVTPHSLRRGGATHLFQTSQDTTMVREVGRWRSAAGMEPYLVTHTRAYQDTWQRAVSTQNSQGPTLGTSARR